MKENISKLTRSFIFNQILFLNSMHTVITLYINMFNFNPIVEKVPINKSQEHCNWYHKLHSANYIAN